MPRTLVAATRRFIAAHPELNETDLPAVVQLQSLARAIDADPTSAALNSQYGTVYRALTKRLAALNAPQTTVDPLEGMLTR